VFLSVKEVANGPENKGRHVLSGGPCEVELADCRCVRDLVEHRFAAGARYAFSLAFLPFFAGFFFAIVAPKTKVGPLQALPCIGQSRHQIK
jgi:hypothetical protein